MIRLIWITVFIQKKLRNATINIVQDEKGKTVDSTREENQKNYESVAAQLPQCSVNLYRMSDVDIQKEQAKVKRECKICEIKDNVKQMSGKY